MLSKIKLTKQSNLLIARGDTIIEVLISIAVAAFAIGTSYAIANNSLKQAITARERNQAVNLIQSQIAALKIRYSENPDSFKTDGFIIDPLIPNPVNPANYPYTAFNFCLDPRAASDSDSTATWARIDNHFTPVNTPVNISSGNGYEPGNGTTNPGCIIHGDDTDYFVNISAQITKTSAVVTTERRTVYKVDVRWPTIGNSNVATSTVYYRL